jgi:hypothetical protein
VTDFVGQIIAYEMGEMTRAEVRTYFQHLIDTNLVWKMPSSYGRMARIFIERGECTPKREDSPRLHSPAEKVRIQPSRETKVRVIVPIVLTALMILGGKLAA